ncbi:MAG: hypothetical protein RL427_1291 [Bacteroidota bacterium]
MEKIVFFVIDMKIVSLVLALFLMATAGAFAQDQEDAALLKVIFTKYYKEEKVIAKGRLQLLSFYCKKAPNNEEVMAVLAESDYLKKHAETIKAQIDITANEDWMAAYQLLFTGQNQYLKSKVNQCVSMEEFKVSYAQHGENNQRLMIISKPIYFANGHSALVKVAFYRTIEHNNSSYLLFEKVNGVWTIKEYLYEWAT